MRTLVNNIGRLIKINQEFLFRGTNYKSFQKNVENGYHWGSYNERYEFFTFVASNIDGAVSYCGTKLDLLKGKVAAIYDDDVVFRNIDGTYTYIGNRPILLAIAHEKYPLEFPVAEEGLVIPGKISLDDIVIIKTEKDLLSVLPPHDNLGAITIQKIKRKAGIFS